MGLPEFDQPVKPPTPAAVTPEDSSVKAAGQRILDQTATKKGRDSTNLTNPAMKTGFAGLLNKTTGSV